MKRFVETERWKDRWFQSLSPVTKLAFSYITDNCDAAGIWEANFEVAEVQIGFAKAGMVVKWKEIFDALEHAIDECEDVSNVLESIALKNS